MSLTKQNIITLLFGSFFLIALACGSASNSARTTPAGSNSQPAQQEEVAALPAKIGNDVTVGDVRWNILEAKDLGQELKADNEFTKPKTTGGKFILVRLEVENRKTEAVTYGGINLIDDKNRKFERYGEQFGFIPQTESCVIETLNPNIVKACSEIFEVPQDATGIKAVVGDLEIFGGDEDMVDLGM